MNTHEWSEASEAISFWFDEPGPWIIEGVVIPRALRKWRKRHPGEAPPFDQLIVMPQPKLEGLKPGQIAMGRGVDTVLLGFVEWFLNDTCGTDSNS